MKRIGEIVPADFPVGGYIGDLLVENPGAIWQTQAQVLSDDLPVGDRSTDGHGGGELCRSFSQWGAMQLAGNRDLGTVRDTLWRGIHYAYRAASNAHPDYVATLRPTPNLALTDEDAMYDRLLKDSFEAAYNYPKFIGAAIVGQEFIDPASEMPAIAECGTIVGFTMVYNHHAYIRNLDARARQEAAEVYDLNRMFAA